MKYAVSQEVALTRDIPERELKKGDVATVVEHHPVPGGEDGYSLEVFNALGHTVTVIQVAESQIEALKEDEVFSVRTRAVSDQGEPYLYHYTTSEALMKIVEEAKIWASRIFFLNDSEEWYLGMRLFKEALKRRKADHSIFEEYLPAVELAIKGEELGGLGPEKNLAMYVCSFSENGDLLSQWRAYCPHGGFALGFRKSKLERLAANQDSSLERCLYRNEDQVQTIERILNQIQGEARSVDWQNPGSASRKGKYGSLINRFNWDIWRTAAILKHCGFQEELEWRFISPLKCSAKPDDFGFHARDDIVVPHRLIDLSDAELWDDVRIVVGPGPHKDKCVHVVRDLLWRKRQVMAAKITPSTIPYRRA